ncbi:MAG: DUF5615 family PIN-like protein [Bacteroidota bacterium]
MSNSRYLIDENLPPGLVKVFTAAGLSASHVNDIVTNTPVKDSAIRRLSLQKNLTVVSRDDDFVKSYIARAVPERLIYVYGSFRKEELIALFTSHLNIILDFSSTYPLVEVNKQAIKAPLEAVEHSWY